MTANKQPEEPPKDKFEIAMQEAEKEAKKEQPKKPEPKQSEPKSAAVLEMEKISTYNGDTTEKYAWSQSISEVTMQIPIPEGTTAKDILVIIKAKHFTVHLKKDPKPIIDGDLQERVKVEDSFWSIEDKKYLNVTFEKAYEAIWKTVIVGDKEIDTKTVDNSKKLEEFDLETQGHLQKVLYEQERKRMGLPTTDEEKQQKLMQEMLAKAGADSPMAGLPYDPNKYNNNKMGSGSGPAPPFRN